MKKIVFMLLVCLATFAQAGVVDGRVAGNSRPVISLGYDDTRLAQPEEEKNETWKEAWQKRRHSLSFTIGFLPITSLFNIFIHAASDDEREPDLLAYSLTYGYELFYLLELGLMVDYASVNDKAVISVIPRLKLNYLNFKYFRLYSYVGLGGIFWNGGSFIMTNVGLLGFELGSSFSVFGEGGYGQVGMLAGGIKFSF